jgi:hypothetical protein
MKDLIVIKRRRNFEWQVRDQNGRLLMRGRERTRPAARYQGYRTLFMMLAVGHRPVGRRAPGFGPEQHLSPEATPDLAQVQRPVRPFTLD